MDDTDTNTDRLWLWWLPFLVASAVFAGWQSFTSQRFLGELMLWDQPWLMPAILDNLAAGTVLAFILIPGIRTAARWVSGAVLLASAVANAQAHFYNPNSADLGVPMWVAIGWSVLPPVAVFVIAHFMVAAKEGTTHGTPVVETAAADTDTANGLPVLGDSGEPGPSPSLPTDGDTGRPAPRPVAAKAKRVSADRKTPPRPVSELADTVIAEGWSELSGDKLAKQLRVSKDRALQARDEARHRLWVVHGGDEPVSVAPVPNGHGTLVE